MEDLILSYSDATPIPTPRPIEEAGAAFDKLTEATLRNREAVNQHLERLAVDVGPSLTAQNYINQYKDSFTNTVNDYVNRGEYAYLGREIQGNVESFLKDKNIKNMRQSWLETDAKLETIRQNENIDSKHKAVLIEDQLANYEYNAGVDPATRQQYLKTGIYDRYNVKNPAEKVDINTPVMKALSGLKEETIINGKSYFIDASGKLLMRPAGTTESPVEVADPTEFEQATGINNAEYPFIFNEVTQQMELSEERTKAMAKNILQNETGALHYLVQDYVVNHPEVFADITDPKYFNTEKGILNRSNIIDGILEEDPIVNNLGDGNTIINKIIDDKTTELAESFAHKSGSILRKYDEADGLLPRQTGGGRGKAEPTVERPYSYSAPGIASTAVPESSKKVVQDIYKSKTDIVTNATTKANDIYKMYSGKSIPSTQEDGDKLNKLRTALLNGDTETIQQIGSDWKLQPQSISDLQAEADANKLKYSFINERLEQGREIAVSKATSDLEKGTLDFNYNPKGQEILKEVGITVDDIRVFGNGADMRNLEELYKALDPGLLERTADLFTKVSEGSNNVVGKVANKAVASLITSWTNLFEGFGAQNADVLAEKIVNNFKGRKQEFKLLKAKISDLLDESNGVYYQRDQITQAEREIAKSINENANMPKSNYMYTTGFENIFNDEKKREQAKSAIVLALSQTDEKGNPVQAINIYSDNNKVINMNDDKELKAIRKAISTETLKIVGVIPSPDLDSTDPLIRVGVNVGKNEETGTPNYRYFNIKLNKSQGIFSDNEDFTKFINSPHYKAAYKLQQVLGNQISKYGFDDYFVDYNGSTPYLKDKKTGEVILGEQNMIDAVAADIATKERKALYADVDFSNIPIVDGVAILDGKDYNTVKVLQQIKEKENWSSDVLARHLADPKWFAEFIKDLQRNTQ
jgi:hypothetical protein